MIAVVAIPQMLGAGTKSRSLEAELRRTIERFAPNADIRTTSISNDITPAAEGICGRSQLFANFSSIRALLSDINADRLLVLGGDCSIDLAPIAIQHARYGDLLHVAYFDAHADVNAPAESPSGALHGMVVRHLLGEGDGELCELLGSAMRPDQVSYRGVRVWDDTETRAIARLGIESAALDAIPDASAIHIHLDLDVLDPREFAHTSYPTVGGPSIAEVASALQQLCDTGRVVGVTVTESIATDTTHTEPLEPIARVLRSWASG